MHVLRVGSKCDLLAPHRRQEKKLADEIGGAMHVAAYEQIVEHGGVVEQFGVLERSGDPEFGHPMSRHPAHVLAVEQHDARIRVVYAVDQVEDRRFAGPVRADDAEHFSPANLEGHVAHRLYAAEAQRQVACFEKRRLVRMCPGLGQCTRSVLR